MKRSFGFLLCAAVLLIVLWLPAIRDPIVSDTAIYSLLGKSIWSGEGYRLFGQLYVKHLPFHAFVSYPFVVLLGAHIGMKTSALVAGIGVLVATFFLMRRFFGPAIAMLASVFVLFHPGFVLMTQLGSADLLFAFLFLLSLLSFEWAKSDRRFYLLMGLLTGLACLTRHNGLPLFVLFPVSVMLWRKKDLTSGWFWSGMLMGALLTGLWMVRSYLISGSIFGSYVGELETESHGPVAQLVSNILYYANPIHNIFPFLFPFSIYGLIRYGRRNAFLVIAMLAAWVLAAVWWVQAIRFAFPGFVILFGFAALGVRDLWGVSGRWKPLIVTFIVAGFIGIQSASLCLYTYGACNAWFDRTFALVPKNMGLSSEGFYTWSLARDWVNANLESGATVTVYDPVNEAVWQTGVFRSDLKIVAASEVCPRYRITQQVKEGEKVLFESEDNPATFVVNQCL